jgi:UDP:flavonoid glycosyltransferase YjiC (YdhE family)
MASAALGAQLVLSAGDLAEGGFAATLPGDPIVVRYAPQLGILDRAAVVVSHGGANSVMEAMDSGVPLLLIPICNDQPVQAHFLAKSGAGLSLSRAEADASRIQVALRDLLAPNSSAARNARRVRDDYRAHDGARAAAAALVSVARGI